jgi:hypothetical protein
MQMRWSKARFAAIAIAVLGSGYGTAIALAGMTPHTGAHITVLSPKPGAVVTRNAVHTLVRIKGMKVECRFAGTANRMGIGHYHIHLDGALVNMFCGPHATISLANIAPGKHTLEFIAAENDHAEDMKTAKKVTFVYRPTNPVRIAPVYFANKPQVRILAPKNGQSVKGSFTMRIAVKNFRLSCALYGKPDLAGYGHWHANIDTNTGMMGGMGTMKLMSCAQRVRIPLAGVKPGRHKFIATLEDNEHAPTIGTEASVTLVVK